MPKISPPALIAGGFGMWCLAHYWEKQFDYKFGYEKKPPRLDNVLVVAILGVFGELLHRHHHPKLAWVPIVPILVGHLIALIVVILHYKRRDLILKKNS